MRLYPTLMSIKDYTPKDRHFTSDDEMKMIGEKLHFTKCTADDLHNMRDMCVMLWGEMREQEKEDWNKSDEIWNAMLSITATIDVELVRRGEEV